MNRGRTWWQRWVYDGERARQRREERTFHNSAVMGILYLISAVCIFAICFGSAELDGTNGFIWTYVIPALLGGAGLRRIWWGINRWRVGGEFNLPGQPGPLKVSSPRDRRGD